MNTNTSSSLRSRHGTFAALCFLCAICMFTFTSVFAAETDKKAFDIPVGEATSTLKQFTTQAGGRLLYAVEVVDGVITNKVKGEMTAREALELMVAGTRLRVVEDPPNKTLIIRREDPPVPVGKPVAGPSDPSGSLNENNVVELSPFQVNANKDYGYRRTNSTTSSRIGAPIVTEPQAIEVISSELLRDLSINDFNNVFRYSGGVTVGENEIGQSGIFTLRGFEMPRLINGMPLANSFSTTPYLVTDNLDRVEIAKGPVSLFYGNSTPNGVANYVTKRPQFIKQTRLELSAGSYNFSKAMVDTQDTINKSTAYRLITSWQGQDARVKEQHREYTFVAPSVDFRPNEKISVQAELNYTKFHVAYPSFAWWWAINPQYYQDVVHPSQQMLDYFKTTYGLADDTAALAKLNERWNSGSNSALEPVPVKNWSSDIRAITGQMQWPIQGSTIDWWRFSPDGDEAYINPPFSNSDGSSWLADVATTVTPLPNLSVRYHWVHQYSGTDFVRAIMPPTGGLRPDGRWQALNITASMGSTLARQRIGESDTQQVDALFEHEAFGMKHKLVAGVEWLRSRVDIGRAPIDYTTAPDPTAWTSWDPFSGDPIPNFYGIVTGASQVFLTSISEFKDYYVSYRGSAFNDRLNLLAGIRHTERVLPANSSNTPTFGAVFKVVPGWRVFASYSQSVLFTNAVSATGPGVLPSDNAHTLANEKGEGIEVGIKTDWRNNTLSGSVSYYRDERSDLVKSLIEKDLDDPRNGGTIHGNQFTYVDFFDNVGVQRVEGIDCDLAWTPNPQFQALLNGEYEFTAKNLSDPSVVPGFSDPLNVARTFSTRLPKTPEWRGNLVVKYNFASVGLRNFSVGGAVRYSSDYIVSPTYLHYITVPAETIVDVFGTYRTRVFNTPTDVHLTLLNVTNKVNDITRSNGFEARLSLGFTY